MPIVYSSAHATIKPKSTPDSRGLPLVVDLDALSKSGRKIVPIIQNDRQVCRVVITKSSTPKQILGLGHVSVLRMR
jgi:hypothetical protein